MQPVGNNLQSAVCVAAFQPFFSQMFPFSVHPKPKTTQRPFRHFGRTAAKLTFSWAGRWSGTLTFSLFNSFRRASLPTTVLKITARNDFKSCFFFVKINLLFFLFPKTSIISEMSTVGLKRIHVFPSWKVLYKYSDTLTSTPRHWQFCPAARGLRVGRKVFCSHSQ